jgi:DNA-binding transcriptional LysR family regulator
MLVKRTSIRALKTAVQTDSLHQLKMLIAVSDFFALLPPEMIESEIKAGILEATPLRAEGNDWPHGYRLHADRAHDPSVRDFLVHLKGACAGMRRHTTSDHIR